MRSHLLVGATVCAFALSAIVAAQSPAAAAETLVPLNLDDVHTLLYDAPRNHILVTGDDALVVLDATSGLEVGRLSGLGQPHAIIAAGDDDHVWLPLPTEDRVVEVDLDTLTIGRSVVTPPSSCPNLSVWALNRVWVELGCEQAIRLSSFDPTATTPAIETARAADLDNENHFPMMAEPGGGRLYVGPSRFSMSGGKLTLAATAPQLFPGFHWDPNGPRLLTNSLAPLDVDTLAELGPGPQQGPSSDNVLASTATDRLILADTSSWFIVTGDGSPVRSSWFSGLAFERGSATWLPAGGAAFAGELDGDAFITIVPRAGQEPTVIDVPTLDRPPRPGAATRVTGTLTANSGPVSSAAIQVSRTLDDDVVSLPDTVTAADGTFTFDDRLDGLKTGRALYTVTFPGDSTYDQSSFEVTVPFIARPWDFNGDGYQDTAIGAPLENVGSIRNAGAVTVTYGGTSGLTAASSETWTQSSPGIKGLAEAYDQFGYATTSDDYNIDGYADLAIGSNGEDAGKLPNCGSVTVIFGTDNGLVGTGSQVQGARDECENTYFGQSLATAADQFAPSSILIGAPGENVVHSWSVIDNDQHWLNYNESLPGIPGTRRTGEAFGASLAAGDFNGDSVDDLAIGIPYDYDDRKYSSGAIVVIYGFNWNAKIPKPQRYSLDTPGVAGVPHLFTKTNTSDQFGVVLAAGDLNGDGFADLSVGAPGADTPVSQGVAVDGGQVTLLYGAASGLQPTRSTRITQETSGVVGIANSDDFFGASTAIDNDRPGTRSTLFVGEAGPQSVHVLPAGTGGGALRLSQETSGVPGSTEAEDGFGWFVRTVHANGFRLPADLLIASPGENGTGALTIVPSGPTGPTGIGAALWTEDTPGIPGLAESGDYWGWLGDSR